MLEYIALFKGMPAAELRVLERYTTRRLFKPNTILFREGDTAHSVYVILSGQVRVYLSTPKGREYTVNTLEPGSYFGELALVDATTRSANVATTQESLLLMLSNPDLVRCMHEQAAVAVNLFQNLALRVRELTNEVRNLALLGKRERLQHLLFDLAEEGEDGVLVIRERPTHEQLAERIGASREMVTRIMRELEQSGHVQKRGRRLLIHSGLAESFLDNF